MKIIKVSGDVVLSGWRTASNPACEPAALLDPRLAEMGWLSLHALHPELERYVR